jgi:hypothetical protein
MPLDFGRDARIASVFPIYVPSGFNLIQDANMEFLAGLNGSRIGEQRCANQFTSVLDLCIEESGATNEVK